MLYHNEVYMPENVLAASKRAMSKMTSVSISRHVRNWLNGSDNDLRQAKHTYTMKALTKAFSIIRKKLRLRLKLKSLIITL